MQVNVLIGTTNPSKIQRFKRLLSGYDVQFLTPAMLGIADAPDENGATPQQNAQIKAQFYGQYCERVITNDSGLCFLNLPDDDARQPGLHVRTPQGIRLNDEEMIAYYSALVHTLGGAVQAYYKDAVAVNYRGQISVNTQTEQEIRAALFDMTDTPHPARHDGWPLDSISMYHGTQRYFVEEKDKQSKASSDTVLGHESRLRAFLVQALAL